MERLAFWRPSALVCSDLQVGIAAADDAAGAAVARCVDDGNAIVIAKL